MNLAQTADLLSMIQLIDNRRVDEAVIIAWHDVVGDLDPQLAREAVRLHRRESTAWITPAHVIANAARIASAVAAPEDDLGNPLPVDREALIARQRVARSRKQQEVTS